MMKDWMGSLALHYKATRKKYPDERLIIVFDIDGTMLDMRFLILHVLREFDKQHLTNHFKGLKISDIDFHEDHIGCLLKRLNINKADQAQILSKYEKLLISSTALLEAHRPFRGVLDVIRWFQLLPNTFVGLNTGRPESLRVNTLKSLNRLAREYRVVFMNDLLFMKPDNLGNNVVTAKVRGIDYFRSIGYRVFAVVDNEPENLQAISHVAPDNEIILLHADTIFKSQDTHIAGNTARGKRYRISNLISQKNLPKHIQFVWRWDGKPESLKGFVQSQIQWIELNLQGLFGITHKKVHHNRILPKLRECIELLLANDKKIKLNLNKKTFFFGDIPLILRDFKVDDSCLWFHGNVHDPGFEGFKTLRTMYPKATIGCYVDFLSEYVNQDPLQAKALLTIFQKWGINRFSLNWQMPIKRIFFNLLRLWRLEVDIYNTTNLENFLQAALMLPDSIMVNLDFPLTNRDNETTYELFNNNDIVLRKTA